MDSWPPSLQIRKKYVGRVGFKSLCRFWNFDFVMLLLDHLPIFLSCTSFSDTFSRNQSTCILFSYLIFSYSRLDSLTDFTDFRWFYRDTFFYFIFIYYLFYIIFNLTLSSHILKQWVLLFSSQSQINWSNIILLYKQVQIMANHGYLDQILLLIFFISMEKLRIQRFKCKCFNRANYKANVILEVYPNSHVYLRFFLVF